MLAERESPFSLVSRAHVILRQAKPSEAKIRNPQSRMLHLSQFVLFPAGHTHYLGVRHEDTIVLGGARMRIEDQDGKDAITLLHFFGFLALPPHSVCLLCAERLFGQVKASVQSGQAPR